MNLTMVELGISKQAHKVCRIARLDVVSLEVECNVPESYRVAVNVECADG